MNLRRPLIFLSTLFMLTLTGTVFGQPQSGYNYLVRPIDQFTTTAGMPIDIPVFLENRGTAPVTLGLGLAGNGSGYFSLDSMSHVKYLDAGGFDVATIHFYSPVTGTFTAMLTVTDGIVTDSLLLNVSVDAGPGPFVILPPFQQVEADLGQVLQVPITIQNLTGADFTVQFSFSGASEFSYTGSTSKIIPVNDGVTILVDFLSNVEGRFSTVMTVTGGGYMDSSYISVAAYDLPYSWVIPFMDQIETMAGLGASVPVMVQNRGGSPVTLYFTLQGSDVFSLDPSTTQMTLEPGMGADLGVNVFSNTPGTYTSLLTVTDGSETDSLMLTAIVHPGPGNFAILPEMYELRALENQPATADLMLQSFSSATSALTVTLTGDSHFTYTGSSTLSLGPNEIASLMVDFAAAAQGTYYAQLTVSDGTESDSAVIIAYVGRGQTGGPLFTLHYDGSNNFMLFEAPVNGSVTKDITIQNISGALLPLRLDFMNTINFTISANSLTLDSGASRTVAVTFNNAGTGYSDGMLLIDGGLQVESLFLMGMTPPYTDYDGLLVLNDLDFGMVDTSSQSCLDVMLENTTQNSVIITNAALSGFSQAFTIQTQNFPTTIPANTTAAITVCFRPTLLNQVENEVLTVAFNNPASTPNAQIATVNLTGRFAKGIRFPGDSSGIVGWYMNTISAPIDGESEATIELFNITNDPITLDNAVWEAGNSLGIYSLLTQLPITIQPHNPAVSNSGKADFTVRYSPTANSSTVGVEDIATVRLESAPNTQPVTMWLTLVGIPVNPAPHTATITLYPKDNRVPSIEMGSIVANDTAPLQFVNNLQVPVTVNGFNIASQERFEIMNGSDFPKTVEPGETITLMLRSRGIPASRSTDNLTMQSSHEHLNSRFDLISGTGVTGIDDTPAAPVQFTATLSPNPSTGRVQIALNTSLADARIQVLDMLGRVVVEQRGSMQNWTWDGRIDGIAAQPGAYHIRISGVTFQGRHVSTMQKAVLVR